MASHEVASNICPALSSGNEFKVLVSNEDAPDGMTKLEVRGMDRANLLGSVCSALARLDVSVVSAIITTSSTGQGGY